MLPPDIRILEGRAVPDGFHARFLSCGTRYTYRMLNSRHASAIRRLNFVHVPVPLDIGVMREAAADLLGPHDFAAFQAAGGTARTTVRTITEAALEQHGDEIIFTVYGNAFLYNMVRIITGTLIEIGHGKRDPDAFRRAYGSFDRLDLGVTAPAHGLELTQVDYPEAAFTDPDSIRWHKE